MESKEMVSYDLIRKIINRYDTIIYELFIFMGAVIIYAVLCQKWLFATIFGLSTLGVHLLTRKEIKNIKKALE